MKQRNPLAEALVFTAFLPLFLFKLGLTLILGAFGMLLAVQTGAPGWAILPAFAIVSATAQACRFNARQVELHGFDVTVRSGTFAVREVSAPIWTITPEYHQNLFERLCDCGTFRFRLGGTVVEARSVAGISVLRAELARRRMLAHSTMARPADEYWRRAA